MRSVASWDVEALKLWRPLGGTLWVILAVFISSVLVRGLPSGSDPLSSRLKLKSSLLSIHGVSLGMTREQVRLLRDLTYKRTDKTFGLEFDAYGLKHMHGESEVVVGLQGGIVVDVIGPDLENAGTLLLDRGKAVEDVCTLLGPPDDAVDAGHLEFKIGAAQVLRVFTVKLNAWVPGTIVHFQLQQRSSAER